MNGQEHEGLFFVVLLARSLVGASLSLYVCLLHVFGVYFVICVYIVLQTISVGLEGSMG